MRVSSFLVTSAFVAISSTACIEFFAEAPDLGLLPEAEDAEPQDAEPQDEDATDPDAGVGLNDGPIEDGAVAGGPTDVANGPIVIEPSDESSVEVGGNIEYTVSGLDNAQAYRVMLIVGGNITTLGDGTGTFVDNDMNGTADAGHSEHYALITQVNGAQLSDGPAKTVPTGRDDPSMPSGIFPQDSELTVTVTAQATGTVYPVVHENGGDSTFLEVDGEGAPVETYIVAGAFSVRGPRPMLAPDGPQTLGVGATLDYTISGLNDAQAYRVTLVVGDLLIEGGDGMATFVDGDMNGAADAGPSEMYALISMVNGIAVEGGGTKTVPSGMDNPMMPSGIHPVDGAISLQLTGVAAGTVHLVVYENGGMSTFLEIGGDGAPTEVYATGGAITVQ